MFPCVAERNVFLRLEANDVLFSDVDWAIPRPRWVASVAVWAFRCIFALRTLLMSEPSTVSAGSSRSAFQGTVAEFLAAEATHWLRDVQSYVAAFKRNVDLLRQVRQIECQDGRRRVDSSVAVWYSASDSLNPYNMLALESI